MFRPILLGASTTGSKLLWLKAVVSPVGLGVMIVAAPDVDNLGINLPISWEGQKGREDR